MRDTGPIRVRRGGDDSRVSSYLGLARKILGEVKQRAAAGGLATLYRALTLSDGTWIRVGTVHGQDLVEIVPVGGEEKAAFRPGFIARPMSDPITNRLLYSKSSAVDWKASVDTRTAPNYQDWHANTAIANSGRASVIHWLGGSPVRYVGGSTRGAKILIDAVEVTTAPANVHGACVHQNSEGQWLLRCAHGNSTTPITVSEAALSFNEESEAYSAGAWETVGSIDVSSLVTGIHGGTQPRLAFWNSSGSKFLFWVRDTSLKYVFFSAEVIKEISGYSINTALLGNSPSVTAQGVWSVENNCLSRTSYGDLLCDSFCYKWEDVYSTSITFSISDGIIACDWKQDTVVYMTAGIDTQVKTLSSTEGTEYGDPLTWSGSPDRTYKVLSYKTSYDMCEGYGTWNITLNSLVVPLPTLYGIVGSISTEFIKNDVVLPETTESVREENLYVRMDSLCYVEDYGGGDGPVATVPNHVYTREKVIRSLAFLDLRNDACVSSITKTNKETSTDTRSYSGSAWSSTINKTTFGEKKVQHKSLMSTVPAYSATSSVGPTPVTDKYPSNWNISTGSIGTYSASRYVTILDFIGPSTYVVGATNRSGDLLCSSEITSGSELLAISYLNGLDPKDVAELGASAYLTEIAAVGA